MDLSVKIKKYRISRGLTQRELGELCGFPTKSADSRIREFESGKKVPKQEILQKIAHALNVSILDLLNIKLDQPADILQILFTLEKQYGVIPHEAEDYSTCLTITSQPFQEIIHLWALFREMYDSKSISYEEYEKRKLMLFDSVQSTFDYKALFSPDTLENE